MGVLGGSVGLESAFAQVMIPESLDQALGQAPPAHTLYLSFKEINKIFFKH